MPAKSQVYTAGYLNLNECIQNAFSENIRASLMASDGLALSAGIDESEILRTTQDIDDYFT